MSDYVVYSYFNQAQVQAVLNAVVMLVGSSGTDGDYLTLLRIGGMMGLMIAVVGGMVKARGEDAGMYMIMMAIFYSVLFTPRVTVTIQDAEAVGAPTTVDHVPVGLAFFASATSKIGHWFTEKAETFFVLPDPSLEFSRTGLMGGMRVLREASSAAISDPNTKQDMVNFMRDCINPELLTNPTAFSSLVKSTAIWSDLFPLVNPGRVVVLTGDVDARTCGAAYLILNSELNFQTTAETNRIAWLISPDAANQAAANTLLSTLLPASQALMTVASVSAGDAVKQSMMINLMNSTSASVGQLMNDPAAVQNAMAQAQAVQSANSSYLVMAKLASQTLPMIRNSIELVILGVFPILLLLVIVAGSKGGEVLRGYVLTMLWVQLWAPLYAIVNFVGTLSGAKSMAAALNGIPNLAIDNSAFVVNAGISAEAVAGMLTISVPIIALALVKGGEVAMTGVVSGLMGPAQQAATKVGGAAGLGNYSAANVQWGNHTENNAGSNTRNLSPRITDSELASVTNGGGTTTTKDGQITEWRPATIGHGVVGGQITSGQVLSNSELSSRTVSGGTVSAAVGSSVLGAVMSQEKSAASIATLERSLQGVLGNNFSLGNVFSGGRTTVARTDAGLSQENTQSRGIDGTTTLEGGVQASRGRVLATPPADGGSRQNANGVAPTVSPGGGVPTGVAPSGAAGAQGSGTPTGQAGSAVAGAPGVAAPAEKPSLWGMPANEQGSAGGQIAAKAAVAFKESVQEKDGSQQSTTGGYSKEVGDKFDEGIRIVNDWASQHRDGRSQVAASIIKASLQDSKQAAMTTTTSVSDTQSAGNERRFSSTTGWSVSGSVGNLQALQAATALYGGDMEKAQIRLDQGHRPTQLAVAAYLAGDLKSSAKPFLESHGMQMPKDPDALKAELSEKVDGANAGNRDEVGAKYQGDAKAVGRAQYADPESKLDTAEFDKRYAENMVANVSGLNAAARESAVGAGVEKVAAIMYNNKNDAGVGHFLRNFDNIDGFNATKFTKADIEKVLTTVAKGSDVIEGGLIAASANGGEIGQPLQTYLIQRGEQMHHEMLDARNGR